MTKKLIFQIFALGARAQVQRNKWKMPLYLVRPEARGIIRSVSGPEPAATNFDKAVSPYFSDPNHPLKYFKLGKANHVKKVMHLIAKTLFLKKGA